MKEVIILGKKGCMKCEQVREKLASLEKEGIVVRYREATPDDITRYKLILAPTVLLVKDGKVIKILDRGLTPSNILDEFKLK